MQPTLEKSSKKGLLPHELIATRLWMEKTGLSGKAAASEIGVTERALRKWLAGGGLHPSQRAKLMTLIAAYLNEAKEIELGKLTEREKWAFDIWNKDLRRRRAWISIGGAEDREINEKMDKINISLRDLSMIRFGEKIPSKEEKDIFNELIKPHLEDADGVIKLFDQENKLNKILTPDCDLAFEVSEGAYRYYFGAERPRTKDYEFTRSELSIMIKALDLKKKRLSQDEINKASSMIEGLMLEATFVSVNKIKSLLEPEYTDILYESNIATFKDVNVFKHLVNCLGELQLREGKNFTCNIISEITREVLSNDPYYLPKHSHHPSNGILDDQSEFSVDDPNIPF